MTLLETFDRHILPHTARVRQLVKRWRPQGDRQEAYQICMIHLWEKLPQFTPEGGSVEAWIDTLVRRRLVSLHRQEQREARLRLDPVQANGQDLCFSLPDPDSLSLAPNAALELDCLSDDLQLVDHILALPPRQREAMMLRAQGKTLHEIAQQLRCSISLVSHLCKEARNKMRKSILAQV